MSDPKPYIDEEDEIRELDNTFFETAKRGRPPMPSEKHKKRVNFTLSPDIIAALKARGPMSTEVEKILRKELGL